MTSRFRWSSSERRLLETILTAELTYSTWGLRGRYDLLRVLLQDDDYDKSESTFWAWIFIWFSFFTPTYHSRYRRHGGVLVNGMLRDFETFLERSVKTHSCNSHPSLEAPLTFQRGGSFQYVTLYHILILSSILPNRITYILIELSIRLSGDD